MGRGAAPAPRYGLVSPREGALSTLLLLLACAELTETGPSGMVGRVRGPDGAPVEGAVVQSLETSDRTDADGRFAVPYKDPDQHVHFTVEGTWYRRRYREADEGRVVDIALPPTRAAELRCGEQTCDATLVWDLDEGLEARATARCAPGEVVPLPAIPTGTPELGCRGASATPTLDDRGDVLALEPPLQALRVELRATEGTIPEGCTVRVGDREARPAGEGFWVAEQAGPAVVTATCAGRPARPRSVGRDAGTVTLDWAPEGPVVDLEELAPWADRLVLVAEDTEEPGWTLAVSPTAEGLFRLPPLAVGTYRFRVDGDAPAETADPPWPAPRSDTLSLERVEGGETLVGRLEVTADLLGGAVPVQLAP